MKPAFPAFKRVVFLALLLALMFTLTACSGGGGDGKFKVSYVGTANILSPDMYVEGTLNGKAQSISLYNLFKGCTVANIDLGDIYMGGTDKGRIKYVGDVAVTFKDGDGGTFDVVFKEGSSFDTVSENGKIYLIPPK